MANAIENWHTNLQDYSDDQIELAGRLFKACLNLLRQLIKECAKSQSDIGICQCLRIEARRFILWGDGIGAEHGALDVLLAESLHLRKTVIYFLDACGTCLTSLASRLSTSSQLSDICKDIKLLQEQVKDIIVESQEHISDGKTPLKKESDDKLDAVNLEMDSTSLSSSESSTGSNETEETPEDLKRYIDCLFDLIPALEDAAKDLAVKNQKYNLSEEKDMSAEVHLFFTEIMLRWPFTDNLFARRLAEANLKRREILRAKLLKVQLSDDEEEADDEGLAISERFRASSWALTRPTSYAATMTSGFNQSAPSETSLASSLNEEILVLGRRVPQLSENHDWGAAFRCILCGNTLRDIHSPARWKKHVFEDLQPYMCSYPDCTDGEKTFASQRAWLNHEFTIHRIDRHWYCFYCPWENKFTAEMCREHIHRLHEGIDYPRLTQDQLDDLISTSSRVRSQPVNKQECPFCRTVVADTVARFGAHVGRHMREISLAAIPFTAHDASGDEFEQLLNEDSEVEETQREHSTTNGSLIG